MYEIQLKKIYDKCKNCHKCSLAGTRNNIVFSDGIPNNKLMLVGEAPGYWEDQKGIPFVGKAGQLLDKIFACVGLSREKDVYICNTIKCRPPENRVPTDEEKAACRKFLNAQIDIINPKAIILCGATALKEFYPTDKKTTISKVRGQWLDINVDGKDYKAMAIFHPSYLLRDHSLRENSPRTLTARDLAEIKATYLNDNEIVIDENAQNIFACV